MPAGGAGPGGPGRLEGRDGEAQEQRGIRLTATSREGKGIPRGLSPGLARLIGYGNSDDDSAGAAPWDSGRPQAGVAPQSISRRGKACSETACGLAAMAASNHAVRARRVVQTDAAGRARRGRCSAARPLAPHRTARPTKAAMLDKF